MFRKMFSLESQYPCITFLYDLDMTMTTNSLNVNKAEIAKFEQIASQWWELTGDFKPLHQLNPLRVQFICQHISEQQTEVFGKKVIDVGCGGGILSESLAKLGANVTGIDMGTEPLNVAKLHALESDLTINYEKITAEEKAQQAKESFDIVTCMEMLEHVPDPASIVNACAQLVKPGGLVFFSTLNKNIKSYLLAIIGAEYLLRWVPRGTHEWKKFLRPSEFVDVLRRNGLETEDLMGIVYDPVLDKWFQDARDLDVNYMLVAEKVAY